ncbi:unnamed protein product [Gadus morhua 'NCC']
METRPVLLPDGGVEDNTKGGVVWSERVVLDWFYFVFYSQLFLSALQEECSSSAHSPLQLFSPRTPRRSRFPATSPETGDGERPVVGRRLRHLDARWL